MEEAADSRQNAEQVRARETERDGQRMCLFDGFRMSRDGFANVALFSCTLTSLFFRSLARSLSLSHEDHSFLTSRMTRAKDSFETSTIWMRRMMMIMMMMVARLMLMSVHRACHVDRHWGSRCHLPVKKTTDCYSTGWNVLKLLAKRIRMNATEQVDRSQSQDDPGKSVRFPSTARKKQTISSIEIRFETRRTSWNVRLQNSIASDELFSIFVIQICIINLSSN